MSYKTIIIEGGSRIRKHAYLKVLAMYKDAMCMSIQDLQTATEQLALAFQSSGKSVEEFRNITKVDNLQNPRGVIPEKYKNNIHAGNRIKKR